MAFWTRVLALLSFLSYSSVSLAIYKCEENGATAYREQPCAGGKTTRIEAARPVEESAVAEAAQRSRREKQTLKQLEHARRKEEAAEKKTRLKQLHAHEAQRKKCKAMALKVKWSEEDAAAAAGKSADKARRSALRQKERYEAECGR